MLTNVVARSTTHCGCSARFARTSAEHVLPGRRPAEPVEARRAEEDGDEDERARNAVGPGEPGERPAQRRPARHAARTGAIRESSENATANPSPPFVQASRPKTAIPASAQ